jgi:hypothetical protein
MKKIWMAGTILASALALAACGGGDKAGNTATGNTSAGNTTAPAGGNASGGNSAATNESAGGSGGEQATGGARQDFTIVNNTGQAVMTLNVSANNSNEWGEDILGRDVLANGEQAQITFPHAESQCNWDIRVTSQGGGTGDWRNINLCETATITLTASE